MNKFYEETNGINRLKVPFEAIYTSVFLIQAPSGAILVDCATTSEDVDHYIVPALGEMGYAFSDIGTLVLTHHTCNHLDIWRKRQNTLKSARVVAVLMRTLCDGVFTYPMAGHTEDCIGILDMRSRTLISGDGLQGAGVDKYRCYTKLPVAYLETVERIQNDERIENILFSHAYEPWCRESIFGRRTVDACLLECLKYVKL